MPSAHSSAQGTMVPQIKTLKFILHMVICHTVNAKIKRFKPLKACKNHSSVYVCVCVGGWS